MITPLPCHVTRVWTQKRSHKNMRRQRALFRFVASVLGRHDIYSVCARNPQHVMPRNAGRN